MAGSTTNISIRMDSELKAQADALFAELGMNLSTAFNIFVRQSLREGGIPFEISLNQPNKETIAAMLEAERIAKDPSVKGCGQVHHAIPKGLQAGDETWPENRIVGAGHYALGCGRNIAGEKQGSRTYRQLGRTSRMSHPARLALGLPG